MVQTATLPEAPLPATVPLFPPTLSSSTPQIILPEPSVSSTWLPVHPVTLVKSREVEKLASPLTLIVPLTVKRSEGLLVPIPTFPEEAARETSFSAVSGPVNVELPTTEKGEDGVAVPTPMFPALSTTKTLRPEAVRISKIFLS